MTANPRPRLSVIMPVYNGAGLVERCLAAIAASDPSPGGREVIVVDDGSTDATAELARTLADRVICLDDGPCGPGRARNAGVREARGDIVAFVDADVLVHPDALRLLVEAFEGADDRAAVFGAYDECPEAPGVPSVYRNLLHRYVHLRGAGEADTFWAGLGAIRRDAFLSVGGFDVVRFPRPQIEDIELGYRLRDEGWRIRLDPRIQGTHLKRWRLRDIVRTDVHDRGIPWMRLLLERGDAGLGDSLNVQTAEKVKTALAALIPLALLLTPFVGWPGGLAAGLLVAALVVWNLPLYSWFAGLRGWGFALATIPLHLLYYLLNGFSAAAGSVLHRVRRPRAGTARPDVTGDRREDPVRTPSPRQAGP